MSQETQPAPKLLGVLNQSETERAVILESPNSFTLFPLSDKMTLEKLKDRIEFQKPDYEDYAQLSLIVTEAMMGKCNLDGEAVSTEILQALYHFSQEQAQNISRSV